MTRGFDRPLYILPFGHRGSFETKMFGWEGSAIFNDSEGVAAAMRRLRSAINQGVN